MKTEIEIKNMIQMYISFQKEISDVPFQSKEYDELCIKLNKNYIELNNSIHELFNEIEIKNRIIVKLATLISEIDND